jgi:hypothetical protein
MSRLPHDLGCTLGAAFVCVLGMCTTMGLVLEDRERQCWQQVLHQEDARGAKLDRLRDCENARLRAKERICWDLIECRLTLRQAARDIANLPDAPDDLLRVFRENEKGATDEERWCRHVIDWACGLLLDEPARAEALRYGLEAELQAQVREP